MPVHAAENLGDLFLADDAVELAVLGPPGLFLLAALLG